MVRLSLPMVTSQKNWRSGEAVVNCKNEEVKRAYLHYYSADNSLLGRPSAHMSKRALFGS